MNPKTQKLMGWIGTGTSMLMYIAYGRPGNPIQPLVAAINCTLWVSYGFFQKKKDWPLIAANSPGIIFGAITFITAIL